MEAKICGLLKELIDFIFWSSPRVVEALSRPTSHHLEEENLSLLLFSAHQPSPIRSTSAISVHIEEEALSLILDEALNLDTNLFREVDELDAHPALDIWVQRVVLANPPNNGGQLNHF